MGVGAAVELLVVLVVVVGDAQHTRDIVGHLDEAHEVPFRQPTQICGANAILAVDRRERMRPKIRIGSDWIGRLYFGWGLFAEVHSFIYSYKPSIELSI